MSDLKSDLWTVELLDVLLAERKVYWMVIESVKRLDIVKEQLLGHLMDLNLDSYSDLNLDSYSDLKLDSYSDLNLAAMMVHWKVWLAVYWDILSDYQWDHWLVEV